MGQPFHDAVNDVAPNGEPSYTEVAICTGTDMDNHPITLVNRFCMNKPALEILQGEMDACQQQLRSYRNISEIKADEAAIAKHDLEGAQWASCVLLCIVAMCVTWIGLLGRKST